MSRQARRLGRLDLVVVFALAVSPLLRAEVPPKGATGQVAHETFTVHSLALAEDRRIHLYRPPGYATLPAPPTVLYLLDGGNDEDFPHPGMMAAIDHAIRAGEVRPMVVVGIENSERRRDMTGPTEIASDKKIAPHVGGSAAFRAFIRDELVPIVKAKVRPGGETALAGESLAGLFVLETLFREPALFDTWVAISPSLWWNGGALAREAPRWMKEHPRLRATLYLARAGDDIIAPTDAFAAALRSSAPAGLVWSYDPRPALHHADIYESLTPSLIRRLWPK